MTAAIVLADTTGTSTARSAGTHSRFGHPEADAVRRLGRAATNLPVRCADDEVRLFPGRFALLVGACDEPVGAMAISTDPGGDEEACGAVLSMPRDRA